MEQDLMEPDQWDAVSAHVAEMNSSLEIINSLEWVGQTAGASAGSVTGIRDGVGEQIPYLMQRTAKSKICRTGRTGSKINWMRSRAKLRTGTNPLCSSFQGEIAIPFTLVNTSQDAIAVWRIRFNHKKQENGGIKLLAPFSFAFIILNAKSNIDIVLAVQVCHNL